MDSQTVHVKPTELSEEQKQQLKEAREQFAQITTGAATTGKLPKDKLPAGPVPQPSVSGLRVGAAGTYRVLPESKAEEAAKSDKMPLWRIELYGIGPKTGPVGIDIVGDVVLGRSTQNVDFDLTPYDALGHGVSRRHAMIRPSASKLYLIDVGSTNGTRVNSVLVTGAMGLNQFDTVTLGGLVFQIRIIDRR